MSTDPNATGEFAMLLTADVKFTNTFQKNTILTHTTISLTLCSRFIRDHAGIVSGENGSRHLLNAGILYSINLDTQLFLQPQSGYHVENCLKHNIRFFGLSEYLTKNRFSYEDQS
jgi:hypothetical protein